MARLFSRPVILTAVICLSALLVLRQLRPQPAPPPDLAPAAGQEVKGGILKAAEGDWPWWRGPTGDGRSPDRQTVTQWGRTENVIWKTPVPGQGHSSPIVCGNRIFLTTAEEKPPQQLLFAFDRKTGKPLWKIVIHEGRLPRKHPKNSHASATPACDGERVYVAFIHGDGLYVSAVDLEGKFLWQTPAGAFRSEHGYGSSPVLYGSLVIVNGDNLQGCFVAALDTRTGKVVWRMGRTTTGKHGSYGTPLVARLAGKPQLILTGMGTVESYDPATGQRLWSCQGPAEVTGCTVACSESLVFATGGFPEKEILAIRADGSGDVTQTHVAWRASKGVAYVPSPLYHDGHLYVVSDNGIASCLDAATGEEKWQERLGGDFTSSPVLAGDYLYATNEAGKTYVVKARAKYELVAANPLGDKVLATPAICGGRLFLRTEESLFCLGKE